MTNTNPITGIRYGAIAFHNIDPDLGQELWYTYGKDVSYEAACEELRGEIQHEVEDEVERGDLDEDDAVPEIESRYERRAEEIQIDEPTIEGEYDGVKYYISWLGGAPLLWVFDGPIGHARTMCSPCVPNAADLDSGYYMEGEPFDPVEEWGHFGFECYVVPRDWLRTDYDSEGGEA